MKIESWAYATEDLARATKIQYLVVWNLGPYKETEREIQSVFSRLTEVSRVEAITALLQK